jgi:hypothetical protein
MINKNKLAWVIVGIVLIALLFYVVSDFIGERNQANLIGAYQQGVNDGQIQMWNNYYSQLQNSGCIIFPIPIEVGNQTSMRNINLCFQT